MNGRSTASPDITTASLAYDEVIYSPAELAAAIEATKTELRHHGINAGSVVVLHMNLTDRYVITLIASTELGCCTVALDPAAAQSVLHRVTAATAAVAVMDDAGITVFDQANTAASRPTVLCENLEDAAYVLFTSGTTAEPKGVVGTRRGLNNRIRWGARNYFSSGANRCAIKTNPGFIDSLTEILTAYHCGQAMIVAPLQAQRDLGLLCDFIGSADIEQITMTPSCIPVLAAVGGDRLRRMRRWIFSGEDLRRGWLIQIRALSPAADIINSYGSTEVCGDATYFVLAAHEPTPDIVPIGKPAAGVSVRIDPAAVETDPTLAARQAGELWIGGLQVAHGYLQAADTDETNRFVRTPDGAHWFRTGDIVYASDERLYFLGRIGDIHKVRGRRVSLAGVAEALETVEGVREAHAWVTDMNDTSALRAAVIAEPGASLTPSSVTAQLRLKVLPHMVPDRVDVVARFHRTASGKIDPHRTSTSLDDSQPSRTRFATGLQHIIASVVSQAVGEPDVSPATAFSDIGLNSLSAVRVADDLGRFFGCHVTALDVLSADGVERLAEQIPALQARTETSSARLVREGDAGRTLLLIHPAVGTCLGYFPLLQHISYPGSVVFLEQNDQARTLLDEKGMEALALYYAQQAVALQHPDAVIDVVGYSFGALIAPSVTRALRSLGGSVSSALLIDPATMSSHAQPTNDWALRRILTDAGYKDYLPDAPLDIHLALDVIREANGPLASAPAVQLRRWADSLRSNVAHSIDYEPTTPSAPTLVVRATKTSAVFAGNAYWLERIASTATVVDVDCTHFELLQGDSVAQLAACMSQFLAGRTAREH